jgi:hypothetical protein
MNEHLLFQGVRQVIMSCEKHRQPSSMITQTKTATSTRDAWVMLILSVELYLLSQVVLSKLSILWGTVLG